MGEGGCRSRVGKVVSGNVNSLNRGNGTGLGRGDALLQVAHLGSERGLVANGRGHTAKKRRDLRARLREAEDVVDEQQDVLAAITEVLGLGKACQSDAQTRSGRLVHLSVDQAGLVYDAGLAHLEEQVGTLAGALAYAGEDGRAAVLLRQIVDELLNQNGLANTSAAEQTGLATTNVGFEKVYGLDAGLENLGLGGQLVEAGRGMVDRIVILDLGHLLAVHRLTHNVPDATEGLLANGHLHGSARIDHLEAALKTIGGCHSDRADNVAGQLTFNLENGLDVAHRGISVNGKGVVDVGHAIFEFDVDNGADDADDVADTGSRRRIDRNGICH